ncbi:MAG: metallophosphoesterase family protein [Phycisphaerae bacterium]
MKLALLGDAHANLPALEAVLADARQQGATRFVYIGDYLGYNAFPNEVVRCLREVAPEAIIGNYDRKVLKFPRKRDKWRKSKHPLKFLAFRWAWEQLSPSNRRYLQSLPKEREIGFQGVPILLCHGRPGSNSDGLTPETPRKVFGQLAGKTSAEVVVFGHTHRQFHIREGGTLFINTGSIGRPEQGDPRACYTLLEYRPAAMRAMERRIEYNVQEAVEGIRSRNLPEPFAEMIRRGRNLTEVLSL